MQRLTDRPTEVVHELYVATLTNEEKTPWGPCSTWTITREGVDVGSMFQGTGGYGERAHCSMTKLLWSGPFPEKCWSPKDPNYGIHFDTGPHDTRELALKNFAERADRLIAWRLNNPGV